MRHAIAGVVLGILSGLASVPASWAGNFFDVSDTGNVGIGTASAGALLDVARPATSSNSELIDIRANGFTQTITGGLTNARFNLFNQYTLSAASAQTVTNGTTLYIAGPPTASGTGPATITTGSALRIAGGTVANTTNAYGLYVDAPTGATNNYAAVFSTGNVGIGTASPAAKLHVSSLGAAAVLQKSSSATGNLWVTYRDFGGSDIAYLGYTGSGSNNFAINNIANGAMQFTTNNVTAMTIDTAGSVGIGTASPQNALHVRSSGVRQLMLEGNSSWTQMGMKWSTNNDWTIGVGSAGANNFFILDQNATYRMFIDGSGNVGIGTTGPGYLLDVAGSAHASSFPTSSDIRLKKNVVQLTSVLPKLEKIKGVAFDWNSTYQAMGRATGHREVGLIAQEVESVFPELVTTWGEQGYRAIDYGRLAGVLVEAIKEQQAEIRELRKEIAALKLRQ